MILIWVHVDTVSRHGLNYPRLVSRWVTVPSDVSTIPAGGVATD